MNQAADTTNENAHTDEIVANGTGDAELEDGDGEAGWTDDESGKPDADDEVPEAQDEPAKEEGVIDGSLVPQNDCRDEHQHIDFVTLGMFIVGKSAFFFSCYRFV